MRWGGATGDRPDRPELPYRLLWEPIVRRALEEDLGRAGDLTTEAVVPADAQARAVLAARRPGRVAGVEVAAAAFRLLDDEVRFHVVVPDGGDVDAGEAIARVGGPARAILSGERVALNFLGRLCGIATATRELVRAVGPHRAAIVSTRKTTPGLRVLEKHAVRCGGGENHRFGLDDAVMVKDNHRQLAGGVAAAVERVRRRVGHMVKVEVEVDSLEQLDELLALPFHVDAVLLDNMPPELLCEAVQRVGGRLITEASGGVTPDTVADIAATGVDLVSVGWLTHGAPALDVGLDVES